ncbi:hypothetical protein AN641_02875 [Candidatus Epulonipiscioides gigas]|nr:hypothetical protein AN641_02875 [Epulopiscium sp. SCG-C07WGA-EpuloA2]
MIKILDTLTINQIAAGEVIERPASVIKELVENSIDAKASSITVEIKNGGIDLMRVTDNGEGFQLDEMEIAFIKHATSKIECTKDLESVLTMGFRGEALSSISSISKIQLASKNIDSIVGKKIELIAGKVINSIEISVSQGTTFIVKDLFFNVPARKAFLKSNGKEASKITDIMYKLALANPKIAFKYFKDDKLIFQTRGNSDLKELIFNLYGKEMSVCTTPVCYKNENIEITGRIGKLMLSKSNRNFELFFINGRYLISKILSSALEEAYKTFTMINKFPVAFLYIKMPTNELDINVHPAKLEARFKNEDEIALNIINAIKESFQNTDLIPTLKETLYKPKINKLEHMQIELLYPAIKPDVEKKELKFTDLIKEQATEVVAVADPGIEYNINEHKKIHPIIDEMPTKSTENIQIEQIQLETFPSKSSINISQSAIKKVIKIPQEGIDYFLLGQIFETYWLIKFGDKVLIMDQHAAHERVMYEKFLEDFKNSVISSQQLLSPIIFRPSPFSLCIIEENLVLLERLGFELETLGELDVIIRGVPFIFNKPMNENQAKEFLENFSSNKQIPLQDEEKIIGMACKAAIKGNNKIDATECKKLIEKLLLVNNPYSCPHGRPILISIEKEDIEKLFKRIV